MKEFILIIFALSLLFSCKQTQLSSKFDKRSNKIYVKPSSRSNDIEIAYKGKKNPKHSNSINRKIKNTFNYNDLNHKDELFADAGMSETNIVFNENTIHQKLTKIKSVLNPNDSTLIEKEEILKISKKAKLLSLLSGSSIVLSLPFLEAFLFGGSVGFLFLPLSIIGLIFGLIGSLFLISSIKKIRKRKEKIKDQNSKVRKNILISLIVSLITLIPVIIGIWIIMWIICCF